MAYEHQEYPKWVKGVIVDNAEQEKALLEADNPKPEKPAKKADPDKK